MTTKACLGVGKHDSRVVWPFSDGINANIAVRWCSRCGAIYHPRRLKRKLKDRSMSLRFYWQTSRLTQDLRDRIIYPPNRILSPRVDGMDYDPVKQKYVRSL